MSNRREKKLIRLFVWIKVVEINIKIVIIATAAAATINRNTCCFQCTLSNKCVCCYSFLFCFHIPLFFSCLHLFIFVVLITTSIFLSQILIKLIYNTLSWFFGRWKKKWNNNNQTEEKNTKRKIHGKIFVYFLLIWNRNGHRKII